MSGQAPVGRDKLYNVISVLFLILTAVSVCAITFIGFTAPRGTQTAGGPEPTLFVIPTQTPTLKGPTPDGTLALTATVQSIITASAEDIHTATPTSTPTQEGPTPTPTETPEGFVEPTQDPSTLTATITATAGTTTATVTATRAPFDYILRQDEIVYTSNFANPFGCNWAGVAGTVFDLSGSHKLDVAIHLVGNGLDTKVTSGSTTAYGTSGWEVKIADAPVNLVYQVRLETSDGTALSDFVTVQMIPECNQNLVLIVFDQIQ
jgi:hypothetical protein